MYDLRTVQIPRIIDSVKFENLCRDLWRNKPDNEPVSFNGRPGQSQDGVDVYGRSKTSEEWFGIQCKVREESNLLTKKEIDAEITKARKFNPSLKRYCLCTTLKRNATIQRIEREIIEELDKCGGFLFQILFWDDIEEMLKDESNINVYYKYYQNFFIDNTTLGHAIGKLVNLELGTGNFLDTHYELVIGKFPRYKDENRGAVNSYRGSCFYHQFSRAKDGDF